MAGPEQAEEELLGGERGEAARAVGEPGLGAEEDGNAESVGGEDGVQGVDAGVAVDPERVECRASRQDCGGGGGCRG